MPIEVGVWRLGNDLKQIPFSSLDRESRLEEALAEDISILSPGLMLVGRQIPTAYGKFLDILAIDAEGNLHVIELKRDRTPRDVVAQLLDYASWVESLSYDQIAQIYSEKNGGNELEKAFAESFGASPPEKLNQSHELVVVASDLDPSSERIIGYLSDNYGVPINAVFFRYFEDAGKNYLIRTWLVDPKKAEARVSGPGKSKHREPWNGRDFYVSLGDSRHRTWEDCMKYGFVSGGGGKWYSQTLDLLFPEARVFVNIPGAGYVGVGTVKGKSVPITEFKVKHNGTEVPVLEAPLKAADLAEHAQEPENYEFFVPVEWIKTVPREQAYWEKGLFAIQHTACRLRNQFTLERLVQHFDLDQ